jgi:hypothetical protein
MKVLEGHQSEDVNQVVRILMRKASSDQSTSYFDFAKYVEVHITEKSTKYTTDATMGILQLQSAHY